MNVISLLLLALPSLVPTQPRVAAQSLRLVTPTGRNTGTDSQCWGRLREVQATMQLRSYLCAAAAVLAACSLPSTSARGELGRGAFIYQCYGNTDATCLEDEPPFPQAIAVGGRFRMAFETIGPGDRKPVAVSSLSTSFVEASGTGFRMLRAGTSAFLATKSNGDVVDITHVRGAEVSEVWVKPGLDALPVARLHLETGDAVRLIAVPQDDGGIVLAGSLDYEWLSGDSSVLEIEIVGALNHVRVKATGAGDTTLEITANGVSFSLPVAVSPAPSNPADAGTEMDAGLAVDAGDTDGGQ